MYPLTGLKGYFQGFGHIRGASVNVSETVIADKFRASPNKSSTDVAYGYTGIDNTGHYTIASKLVSVISSGQPFELTGGTVEATTGVRLIARDRIDGSGGIALATPPAVKTANYTMAIASDFFIEFDPTPGAITVALPAAASSRGVLFAIRKDVAHANAVTIDPNAAELIDGAATLVVADNTTKLIMCDGVGWRTIGTL